MTTVITSRLAEKVRAFIRSDRFLLVRLGVALLLCLTFMCLSVASHPSLQFGDMEAGFYCLTALYAAKVVSVGLCTVVAYEEPQEIQRRVLTAGWLIGGLLRVGAALSVLATEAHFVGHGLRGGLWVALIGYQFLAASMNFASAYGEWFGFDRFNLKARRAARWEKALVADLMDCLKE